MEEPIENNTQEREDDLLTEQQDIFSYYRRLRSNLFSDTEVVYETKLTPELFDLKLQQLSQDKKQSEFENFVLVLAARLVTPNIKPQTGPDGGGDGKVDGETYPVDKAISDRWWVSEGSTGDQKWAIAISVQKNWKSKIEGDVQKAVETGRGYTKVIFFSNQKIKSSTRQEVEDELSKQYGVAVSIFDGKWCSFAVFEQDCYDVATDKLNFSEEYRRKTIKEGSHDKRRKEELEQLENDLLSRQVESLDTDYIDDLLQTCILSRGLERPRMETEGRFNRAQREAEAHGSPVQRFNITYNHAWTSFFWFHDVNAMYADYLKLKEFTKTHTTVHTIELMTNILTNLENAAGVGLFDSEKFCEEVKDLKTIKEREDLSQASRLFLELFFTEHRLLQLLHYTQDPTSELKKLSELIEACANYPDISFNAQITIVEIMGRVIDDNDEYEKLIDKISEISSQRKSEVEGALIHFNRAQTLIDKQQYKPVVKHLGHCVQAFQKEGYESELVKTYGYMGIALYNLELPYSGKAYLVKAASILVKEFFTKGSFNYTSIIERMTWERFCASKSNLLHIHGSLAAYDDIVFGVEDSAKLSKEHVFLYKAYNQSLKAREFSLWLNSAGHIIFYGYSLGDTDRQYFEKFFQKLCSENSRNVNLVFYYYGQSSYDNLIWQLQMLTKHKLTQLQTYNQIEFIDCSM